MVPGWVPGIALPAHPASPHTPGTPLPPGYTSEQVLYTAGWVRAVYSQLYMAVGLKSVDQLTLRRVFSGFQVMTEVYNLVEVGRINNHLLIPGTD